MLTDSIATGKDITFLYKLLINPEFRWARYLLIVVLIGIISFNQVFIFLMDYRDTLGAWIYFFIFIYLLTYTGVVSLNLFWLLPAFLLKRRYLAYISLLSAAMLIAMLIQIIMEFMAYAQWPEIHARGSYRFVAMLMDYISSFILTMLCTIGGTMTVLLKEWMTDHQRVSQMEKACMLSEMEQLKEQVSPELLFKTLHRSGELTLNEPDKASKMLMKLSQLLRYQLYDCNRQKVLLSGEIAFLTNYLTLEQNSLTQFSYELTSEGEVQRMLIPPLLFIPFVQYVVKLIHELRLSIPVYLKIHLKVEKNTVAFTCSCPDLDLSTDKGLERIRQRLNILYDHRYELSLTTKCIRLKLNGGEL